MNVSEITVQCKAVMIPGCKVHTAFNVNQEYPGDAISKVPINNVQTLPQMDIFFKKYFLI